MCISHYSQAVSIASSLVYTGFKEGSESSSKCTLLCFKHSGGPRHTKINKKLDYVDFHFFERAEVIVKYIFPRQKIFLTPEYTPWGA